MNNGILELGYAAPITPRPLLGLPQPVPVPYAQPEVDPFWNNVILLLRMDGANGSSTFVDASSYSLPVVAGSTARHSNAQRMFGETCASFDGSASSALTVTLPLLGTSDFTLEFWFFRRGNTGEGGNLGQSMMDTRIPDTANVGWEVVMSRFGGAARPSLFIGTSGVSYGGTPTGIKNNEWGHFAACRSGTVSRYFLNGVLVGSGNIGSLNAANPTLRIGTGANGSFFGFMSELRVTRGIARYTGSFAPPTRPYPAGPNPALVRSGPATDPFWSNVSLLLPMDGDNNSTTFTDASDNKFAVTANGDAKISTAQAKFGRSSAVFDGTGDSLALPYSVATDIGGVDFTLEAWIYVTNLAGNTYHTIFAKRSGVPGYSLGVRSNGSLTMWNGSVEITTSGVTIQNNTWYHVAWSRSGSTMQMFVDGVQYYSQAYSIAANTNAPRIGTISTVDNFFGHIQDLRITRGTARYTANFTPPAAPLPTRAFFPAARRTADPHWNNVSLLIRGNGVNASTAIRDLSSNAFPVTVSGNTQISTAQSKYGGSSLLFDGTGDFLGLGTGNAGLAFGAGDFTIEAWIYRLNTNTANVLCGQSNLTNAAGSALVFYVSGSATTDIYTGSTGLVVTSPNPPINEWAHIAMVRDGTNLRTFLNGQIVGSRADLGTAIMNTGATTHQATIGAFNTGANALNGYISDLRVTKGIARYTAAFTPPSSLLPEY